MALLSPSGIAHWWYVHVRNQQMVGWKTGIISVQAGHDLHQQARCKNQDE
jgi:hypothetical protein